MKRAYGVVYGKPYLYNSLKYDADSETFYGSVKSTKGSFSEKISFHVPIERAEAFERNVESIKPELAFAYRDSKLLLEKITLVSQKKSYLATLNETNYKSETLSVALGSGALNLPASPLLSTSLDIESSAYAIGEVNYSKDPEIAKLQKKKEHLQKLAREKRHSKAREEKLQKQKLALEAQIAQLQDTKGGVDDIPTLLKKSKKVKTDPTKWLFVVAIENYEYTDPVPYSKNSAKQFSRVMQKRLGVSEKNSRVLINTNATSGKIRHNLKEMLHRVKSEDTIYFYYSGHGIPVPSQKNAPYLLAQDMSPEYVADDQRFKLQNIYKALSSSKAKKVIAFVDSCFSGGTDNQALIKGVAATRIKPKKVTFDKSKMLVISAGSGTEYSNKYDEKSNRLFSYYLMRGLLKEGQNTQRLYDYVKSNVQEKSYEMGESYEQVPVYDGNIGLKL
ncbi:MAG: caspase family protein [Campylobacterota bacterium]|nr:caspase family protein [Campylobacterota bacterium]